MKILSQGFVGGVLRVSIMALLTIAGAFPAEAEVLNVGAGQTYANPSEAIAAAKSGDTIKIAPGTYFDCAVVSANNLTIQGSGYSTIMTDKTCQGKAIFVIDGNDVTVRNLTLQRARVADGNGAGIRAEGNNLNIDAVKFFNNQDGILAADLPQSTITISNSDFLHNGACIGSCAHGVYVGHIALLKIQGSRFFDTQVGHHIKSRALKTIVSGCHIEDGPSGTASYEVDIPNGGSLVMSGNILEKGHNNQNHSGAISIGEEGVTQPTGVITIQKNTFTNDGPPTTFVKNITATPANLIGNILKGNSITPLTGDGTVH